MTDLARDLEELFARERESALRADVEDLELIQVDKRALFDQAEREGGFEPAVVERLGSLARANVGLIRQLVSVHRALAGLPPRGYGHTGRQRSEPTPSFSRGVL